MPENKFIGQKIKRREDPRLITGTSHYVDDLKLHGMLHMALLRSMHAHARIRSIRTEEAAGQPGVVAILTGNEVRERCGTIPCASSLKGLKVPAYHLLAVDKVLFVGQPVAAVIAEDRYLAGDALDLIEVDYEPLIPVVNPERALEKGSPKVHDQFEDNLAYRHTQKGGNLEKAFAEAHKVVRQRMINQRLAPVALEPRGVLAEYLPGEGMLNVWSSTQIPHLLRTQLANIVRLPEHRVRIITPEVGGGFGSKLNVYAEEGLVAYAAMKIGRPVKWTETRRENLQATIHGRDQINEVEAAVQKDGRITGLRVRIIADLGAYHQLLTPAIPTLTALMLSGPYKIPNIECEVLGVFTNKMATDAYRGAGRPEATYLLERIVDRIAQELAMDPAQV
ncbi:MAG: xanthine dehydrogenase family protein molybdopterin-binding subunit, partial [Acidobacteria bacterium]|nr:xanthine dehydrogenase family protein molybdopterin-binding subunit [Acidobacteriota bacterium]